MKKLLEKARERFSEACNGIGDLNAINWHMGYIQAIKDIDKKLKTEGIDELEDE